MIMRGLGRSWSDSKVCSDVGQGEARLNLGEARIERSLLVR
jgi:hypothetical protein